MHETASASFKSKAVRKKKVKQLPVRLIAFLIKIYPVRLSLTAAN